MSYKKFLEAYDSMQPDNRRKRKQTRGFHVGEHDPERHKAILKANERMFGKDSPYKKKVNEENDPGPYAKAHKEINDLNMPVHYQRVANFMMKQMKSGQHDDHDSFHRNHFGAHHEKVKGILKKHGIIEEETVEEEHKDIDVVKDHLKSLGWKHKKKKNVRVFKKGERRIEIGRHGDENRGVGWTAYHKDNKKRTPTKGYTKDIHGAIVRAALGEEMETLNEMDPHKYLAAELAHQHGGAHKVTKQHVKDAIADSDHPHHVDPDEVHYYLNKMKAGKSLHEATEFKCNECMHKFTKKGQFGYEVRCPKCKGFDTDLSFAQKAKDYDAHHGKNEGYVARGEEHELGEAYDPKVHNDSLMKKAHAHLTSKGYKYHLGPNGIHTWEKGGHYGKAYTLRGTPKTQEWAIFHNGRLVTRKEEPRSTAKGGHKHKFLDEGIVGYAEFAAAARGEELTEAPTLKVGTKAHAFAKDTYHHGEWHKAMYTTKDMHAAQFHAYHLGHHHAKVESKYGKEFADAMKLHSRMRHGYMGSEVANKYVGDHGDYALRDDHGVDHQSFHQHYRNFKGTV